VTIWRSRPGLRGFDIPIRHAVIITRPAYDGTQAMKMNITFCVSSMPNQRMGGETVRDQQVASEQRDGAAADSDMRHIAR
jgi:hypothetical protein